MQSHRMELSQRYLNPYRTFNMENTAETASNSSEFDYTLTRCSGLLTLFNKEKTAKTKEFQISVHLGHIACHRTTARAKTISLN